MVADVQQEVTNVLYVLLVGAVLDDICVEDVPDDSDDDDGGGCSVRGRWGVWQGAVLVIRVLT